MRGQRVTDHPIAEIAARQGGVVSRAQLVGLGLSTSGIDRRVGAGRLHRIHRGVYAVGHPQVGEVGRRWAAVLACAPGAVLSHESAGAAWDLVRAPSGAVHVTIRPGGHRAVPGIRLHRSRSIGREITTLEGLPVTTVARTLIDLAGSGLRARRLEALVDRAEQLHLVDFAELRAMCRPGRSGSAPPQCGVVPLPGRSRRHAQPA